jgi:hypothetical protein
MLQHAAFQPESGVDAPILSSQAQSQPTRKLPPRLQAAAIISLGKLSVQNEEMAKQVTQNDIPLFRIFTLTTLLRLFSSSYLDWESCWKLLRMKPSAIISSAFCAIG